MYKVDSNTQQTSPDDAGQMQFEIMQQEQADLTPSRTIKLPSHVPSLHFSAASEALPFEMEEKVRFIIRLL